MSRLASNIAAMRPATPVDFTPPVTGEETLKRLRERRRIARTLREVASGQWYALLREISKHRFPAVKDNHGRTSQLCVKLNHIGKAMGKHAEILAGNPPSVTAPEGYDAQQVAINDIINRCHFPLLLMEAARLVNVETVAYVSACVRSGAGGTGPVLCVEKNEMCFPVGRLGPDGQPTAYERRWVIERPDPTRKDKKTIYLRVESHWVPEGSAVAAIAQRAYLVDTTDVLAVNVGDPDKAKPVPMTEAVPGWQGSGGEENVLLPGPELDIVQLVIGRSVDGASGSDDAAPRSRLDLADLDLIASMTSVLTRYLKAMDAHGAPKARVPESALDPKDGSLDQDIDAFVDPDKEFEYITNSTNFTAMLDAVEKVADWLLTGVDMAPALMGVRSKDAPSHTTYGELELNASSTLASAMSAARYFTPPLQRVWTVACRLASAMPGGMFDVAPVSVRLSPGLYQGFGARVQEQREALDAGLTSRRRAIAAIHGDENADAVLAEIEADEDRKADLAAKSLMTEMAGVSGAGALPAASGGDAPRVQDEGASA